MVEEERRKEKMAYQGYAKALFFTHLIPLKKSQQYDSNHTLKDHQTRS
jgi:hypothetical protein